PLHGDHQLDQLAAQFAHWRQTRTHFSERIFHELWEHAVTLAATLPPSRVAKQVRVRLMDLKKRMATRCEGTPPESPLFLSFVEVLSVPPGPPLAVYVTQIELSRADGIRLCMHIFMSPRRWKRWYGFSWRDAHAAAHPAKPHLCRHRAGGFSQRYR